jgi:hypothetical protein
MRRFIIAASIVTGTLGAAAAQPPDANTPLWTLKPLEMSGCNTVGDEGGDRLVAQNQWITLPKHRPVGTGAVAHVDTVPIAGGLLPTPNIAARVGDLDPTVAAMAFIDRAPEKYKVGMRLVAKPVRAAKPVSAATPFRISCPPVDRRVPMQ